MQCTLGAAVTPTVRVEGLAELMGDIVITCTGGTPTASGQNAPTADIVITLNANVTSRVTSSNFSEAVLIIDDPHSATNPSVPLTVCDPTNVSSGVCSIQGNMTGLGVYSGTSTAPNVFQGRITASNEITFTGVPVDPPGAGTRTLRITNLRANVNPIGVSSTLTPTQVVATITVTPSSAAPLATSQMTVAFILNGAASTINEVYLSYPRCSGVNSAIAANPQAPLGTGFLDGEQMTIVLTEGFPASWKERNVAMHLANSITASSFPSDVSQDVPGANYFSESGFEAVGVTPGSPPVGYGPFLPAATAFPSVRGLNVAGTADAGTRLYVQFTGVPAGTHLFVPVTLTMTKTIGASTTDSGRAVLVATSANGPFGAVTGSTYQFAELPATSGVSTAIYEVVYQNPFELETLKIPVALAFTANQPATGTAYWTAGFWPVSSIGTAGTGLAIPRFVASTQPHYGFGIGACANAPVLTLAVNHTGSFTQGQRGAAYQILVSSTQFSPATSGAVTVTEAPSDGLAIISMSGTGWTCGTNSCTRSDPLSSISLNNSYPPITVTVDVAPNATSPQVNTVYVSGGGAAPASATDSTQVDTATPTLVPNPSNALAFYPITPCRAADTRASQPKTGAFGPPALVPYVYRDFSITGSGCGVPTTAQAFSLNVTALPPGPLDWLSMWAAGLWYPGVSTLNSPSGTPVANGAIAPAGTNGAITVVAGQATDLILDVNGYFAPQTTDGLLYYSMTPCRVLDTRTTQGKTGLFGPPGLLGYVSRDVPMLSSTCNIPATAQAYALNVTALPSGYLGFVSMWPTGQSYPGTSTLNSWDGNVVANAAVIPAGNNGSITVVAGDPTELILDINGYFAPPAAGGLHFYPMLPCRVADTRSYQNFAGSFGAPGLAAYSQRSFPITASTCQVPGAAQAYSLNITAVPQGSLDFLSMWPTGGYYSGTSTLNSPAGRTIANAAILPAGASGAITLVVGKPTDVIIDINGYFAP
ncbi:MAG: hypothetical protein JSU00_29955 [Acidobacteria bacterium]|nr:hypothetical protein [Acidobacteriota bacterium]